MPGVSHRGPVPGAYGLGKVQLKFKPYKKKTHYVGAFIYASFLACLAFSFFWSKDSVREFYLVPSLKASLRLYEHVLKIGTHDAPAGASAYANQIWRDYERVVTRGKGDAPYIIAESTSEALFFQGFLHAQDRLFALDTSRRVALGRLAALLGNAASNSSMHLDRIAVTLDFHGLAESDWNSLPAEDKIDLQAYSDGINAYLQILSQVPVAPNEPTHDILTNSIPLKVRIPLRALPVDYDAVFGISAWHYVLCYATKLKRYLMSTPHQTANGSSNSGVRIASDTANRGSDVCCDAHYEVDLWEPQHSLAIMRLLAYEWSAGWEEDLLQRALNTVNPLSHAQPPAKGKDDESGAHRWDPSAGKGDERSCKDGSFDASANIAAADGKNPESGDGMPSRMAEEGDPGGATKRGALKGDLGVLGLPALSGFAVAVHSSFSRSNASLLASSFTDIMNGGGGNGRTEGGHWYLNALKVVKAPSSHRTPAEVVAATTTTTTTTKTTRTTEAAAAGKDFPSGCSAESTDSPAGSTANVNLVHFAPSKGGDFPSTGGALSDETSTSATACASGSDGSGSFRNSGNVCEGDGGLLEGVQRIERVDAEEPALLDCVGASVPGVPYVWVGRNRHISWTITPSAYLDTEDVHATTRGYDGVKVTAVSLHSTENLQASDPLTEPSYNVRQVTIPVAQPVEGILLHKYDQNCVDPERELGLASLRHMNRTMESVVKLATKFVSSGRPRRCAAQITTAVFPNYLMRDDGKSTRQHNYSFLVTHSPIYGPIISDSFSPYVASGLPLPAHYEREKAVDPGYSVQSSSLMRDNRISLGFLRGLSRARDFPQFLRAAETAHAHSLNVLYADRRGNIGLAVTGRSIRHSKSKNSPSRENINELAIPHSFNPKEGIIVVTDDALPYRPAHSFPRETLASDKDRDKDQDKDDDNKNEGRDSHILSQRFDGAAPLLDYVRNALLSQIYDISAQEILNLVSENLSSGVATERANGEAAAEQDGAGQEERGKKHPSTHTERSEMYATRWRRHGGVQHEKGDRGRGREVGSGLSAERLSALLVDTFSPSSLLLRDAVLSAYAPSRLHNNHSYPACHCPFPAVGEGKAKAEASAETGPGTSLGRDGGSGGSCCGKSEEGEEAVRLLVGDSDIDDVESSQNKEISPYLALIGQFDGYYTRDAEAPVLLEAFRAALAARLTSPHGISTPHSPASSSATERKGASTLEGKDIFSRQGETVILDGQADLSEDVGVLEALASVLDSVVGLFSMATDLLLSTSTSNSTSTSQQQERGANPAAASKGEGAFSGRRKRKSGYLGAAVWNSSVKLLQSLGDRLWSVVFGGYHDKVSAGNSFQSYETKEMYADEGNFGSDEGGGMVKAQQRRRMALLHALSPHFLGKGLTPLQRASRHFRSDGRWLLEEFSIFPKFSTKAVELSDKRRLIKLAFEEAVRWCEKHFGKAKKLEKIPADRAIKTKTGKIPHEYRVVFPGNRWQWGQAHAVMLSHAAVPSGSPVLDAMLSQGPTPTSGAPDSLLRSGTGMHNNRGLSFETWGALTAAGSSDSALSTLRMVVDMSEPGVRMQLPVSGSQLRSYRPSPAATSFSTSFPTSFSSASSTLVWWYHYFCGQRMVAHTSSSYSSASALGHWDALHLLHLHPQE